MAETPACRVQNKNSLSKKRKINCLKRESIGWISNHKYTDSRGYNFVPLSKQKSTIPTAQQINLLVRLICLAGELTVDIDCR